MSKEKLSATWRARGLETVKYLTYPGRKPRFPELHRLPKRKWQAFVRFVMLDLAHHINSGDHKYPNIRSVLLHHLPRLGATHVIAWSTKFKRDLFKLFAKRVQLAESDNALKELLGVSTVTPVHTSTITAAHQSASPILAAIDIEGDPRNPFEVSIVLFDPQYKPIIGEHLLSAPDTPHAWSLLYQHGPYSHGLCSSSFRFGINLIKQSKIHQHIKQYITSKNIQVLVSNCSATGYSDIRELIDICGINSKNITHVRATLRPWKERRHTKSHKMALRAKNNNEEVGGINCNISVTHTVEHKISFKDKRKSGDSKKTVAAKEAAYPHCALYDCFEVILALKYDEVEILTPALSMFQS